MQPGPRPPQPGTRQQHTKERHAGGASQGHCAAASTTWPAALPCPAALRCAALSLRGSPLGVGAASTGSRPEVSSAWRAMDRPSRDHRSPSLFR